MNQRWLPTPALSGALGLLAVLSLLATTLSRPDLLVIALPIGVATLLGLLRRAYRMPQLAVGVDAGTLLEGESTRLRYQLRSAEVLDAVQLRPVLRGRLALRRGGRQVCTRLAAGQRRELSYRLSGTRWGRGHVESVALTAFTAGGLLRADAVLPALATVRILPLRQDFAATDAMPRAAGVVGPHRSLRIGEGIDLAGVRPFVTGDRLRRINWPVSQRTRQLHVSDTYSDRDAEVVLVLDTSGPGGLGQADSPGTVDQAVRAAASIAEHYLRSGDRVGLLDLSRPARPIRSRSGRGQLNRLLDALLDVQQAPATDPAVVRALARIAPRALVMVLSPLLTEEVGQALAGVARSGRTLLVVDTLPAGVRLDGGSWTELAWQIELLRRENLIDSLALHGVPTVAWLGSGSLDAVLVGLSRMVTAARRAAR